MEKLESQWGKDILQLTIDNLGNPEYTRHNRYSKFKAARQTTTTPASSGWARYVLAIAMPGTHTKSASQKSKGNKSRCHGSISCSCNRFFKPRCGRAASTRMFSPPWRERILAMPSCNFATLRPCPMACLKWSAPCGGGNNISVSPCQITVKSTGGGNAGMV